MTHSLSDSTGFVYLQRSEGLLGLVNQRPNPLETVGRHYVFNYTDRTEAKLCDLVKKSAIAYTVDGIVRQAVDKYTEIFVDFRLDGEEKVVEYLRGRLEEMSLTTGEHWKTLLTRVVHEYFKTGNSFLLKTRGGGRKAARRPLYKNRPYTLSGLFLVPAQKLVPFRDGGGRFLGWKLERPTTEKVNLVSQKGLRLDPEKALIEFEEVEDDDNVFYSGADIVHVAYKRPAEAAWGVGLTFPALEDVSLLRTIEQSVAVLIKKYSNPIIHHRVLRPANPQMGIQAEINLAMQLHQKMSPEGVIVTGGQHEIKAIGSESQALRLEGYLKYFSSRAFSGMGLSPYIMGFEAATLGTAEASKELMMTKIRYCQSEIAREIETFVFNELLWEGGYDPFMNDEHRVRLIFEDADELKEIKLQNHYADMYSKNFLGLSEARYKAGITEAPKMSDFFMNKVDIPLIKAKAKAQSEFPPPSPFGAEQPGGRPDDEKPGQGGDAKGGAKGAPPKSGKAAPPKAGQASSDNKDRQKKPVKPPAKEVANILPRSVEEIEDFALLLEHRYGIDRSLVLSDYTAIEGLIEDPEALVEYVWSFFSD